MSRDSPFYISEGKDRIRHAVIGLLIILGSYVILWTINPDLVRLDIFQNIVSTETSSRFYTGPGGQPQVNPQEAVSGKWVCVSGCGSVTCGTDSISAAQCGGVPGCSVQGAGCASVCRCAAVAAPTNSGTPAPPANVPGAPGSGPNPAGVAPVPGGVQGTGSAQVPPPPPPPPAPGGTQTGGTQTGGTQTGGTQTGGTQTGSTQTGPTAPAAPSSNPMDGQCITGGFTLCMTGVSSQQCTSGGCTVEDVSGGFDRCRC